MLDRVKSIKYGRAYWGIMELNGLRVLPWILKCLHFKHSTLGRFENGFFEDDEEETDGEDFRIKKWDEDYEDNPYDILRVMLNYIDNDAGTALHLATKVRI